MADPRIDEHGLKRFSDLSGWKLEEGHQDVRNMPLHAPDGKKIGRIDELLVDEDAERVAAIRLEDGRVVPVEPLEILDDKVIDHGGGHVHGTGARTYEARTVRPA
jgi:hypothetical protein